MITAVSKIQIEGKRQTADRQTGRERQAWSAGNGHATSDSQTLASRCLRVYPGRCGIMCHKKKRRRKREKSD